MIAQLIGNSVSGGFYRRTSTCKAPRKRSFLVRVQSRAPRSEAAVVGGDGSDGNGKGPCDRRVRCWDNDNNGGGDNNAGSLMTAHGLLASVAAAAVLAVSMPHPATAAFVKKEDVVMVCGGSVSEAQEEGEPSSGLFTEEEKELLAPRQYRVREWVYVH